VWTLAALATLPAFSWRVDGPAIMPVIGGAMVLLTLMKRFEANRRPLPSPGPERRRVIIRRLLFDRDINSHHDWIRRTPDHP
jgi:hypothetical protein